MIEATLADLRQANRLTEWDDVVHLLDARKKNEVGFFVPAHLAESFLPFLQSYENRKKSQLLQRVARAQADDPIEEGGIADGIDQR